ncbi:hypothetical protein D3C85_1537300 [compost metagenome]
MNIRQLHLMRLLEGHIRIILHEPEQITLGYCSCIPAIRIKDRYCSIAVMLHSLQRLTQRSVQSHTDYFLLG